MAKKKCTKGFACGKSCIAKNKLCRVELSPEASAVLDEKRGTGKTLDSYIQASTEFLDSVPMGDLEGQIEKARKDLRKKYSDKKDRKLRDLEAQRQERILAALKKLGSVDTPKIRWERENEFFGRNLTPDERDVAEQQVNQFMELVGSNPFGNLSLGFVKESDRAWARKVPSLVNVGNGKTSTMFHELGHHVEYNNPELAIAAVEFRDRRATSTEVVTREKEGYGANEQFLQGKYIDGYMGKVYGNGATEVISMGLEWFTTPYRMDSLQKKRPGAIQLHPRLSCKEQRVTMRQRV